MTGKTQRKPERREPYVRARMRAASPGQRARERRDDCRRLRAAPGPPTAGSRFTRAFDLLRAAARYSAERSYRSAEAGHRAAARREQIRDDAAQLIAAAADEIAALVPESFRPSPNLAVIRAAPRAAASPKERADLAAAWLMLARRRAERYARLDGGAAQKQAELISDRAAVRLTGWTEEMDADDYGQ
jgi:hypothetical protein